MNDFIYGVRPVVLDTEGHRYYGLNHCDCITSIPKDKKLDVTIGDFGHAFEKEDGTIIGREEAARFTGLATNVQSGKLHSEDLHWTGAAGLGTRTELFEIAINKDGVRGFDKPDGTWVNDDFVSKEEQSSAYARSEEI